MTSASHQQQFITALSQSTLPVERDFFVQSLKGHRQSQIHVVEEVACLLQFLVGLKNSGQWLEIGTLAGFSAAVIATSLKRGGGSLITIEKSPEMADLANKNLQTLGLIAPLVEIKIADGLQFLAEHPQNRWDGVFLDANKAAYREYVHLLKPQLKGGGLLIIDNIFMNNEWLSQDPGGHWSQSARDNMQKMVQESFQDPNFSTTLLPIRDGVLLMHRLTVDKTD